MHEMEVHESVTPSPQLKKARFDEPTCSACTACTQPSCDDVATGETKLDASRPEVPKSKIGVTRRREDYLEWDDYFMAVAFLGAQRSKDPSTQVGACIVNERNRIVGIGYNGFPMGCADDALPWAREPPAPEADGGGDAEPASTSKAAPAPGWLETKYPYVCHAEMNAILNKNAASVEGCRIYVALFPCNECAKLIIQSGIREVVFLSDKYHAQPAFVASRRLFELARVATRRLTPKRARIVLDMGAYM